MHIFIFGKAYNLNMNFKKRLSIWFPYLRIENSGLFLCGIAAIYVLVAYKSSGYHQEDEHYQIIEFANYKLGLLPINRLAWEYEAQIRPGLQPLVCYFLLKIFHGLGINDGYDIAFLLRALSAIFSIFVISRFVDSYKSCVALKVRPYFIFLSYLLWFLPYINVRFSSESWSGMIFLLTLAVIQRQRYKDTMQKYLAIGALLGFAVLLRYQSGLLVVGVMAWFIFVYRINLRYFLLMTGALLAILCLGVLVDLWLYGELTISMYKYFEVNLIQGVSSNYGVSPFYEYVLYMLKAPGPFGICILVSLLVVIAYFPKNIMLWAIIPFVFIHSLIPHKELRFLYPIVNLVPVFLIISYQKLYKELALKKIGGEAFRKAGIIMLVALFIANIMGLTAIASTGAGTNKTVITEWIHRTYGEKNLNIILINGENPYVDWGPPKNSYYSSDGVHLNNVSSIWQPDFLKYKKAGYTNLLVTSKDDISGVRTAALLRRLGLVKVYKNIPDAIQLIYQIYNPSLNDLYLEVYELK